LSLDKCLMAAVNSSKENACARVALMSSSICGVDFRWQVPDEDHPVEPWGSWSLGESGGECRSVYLFAL
jgi:hypothetical protein